MGRYEKIVVSFYRSFIFILVCSFVCGFRLDLDVSFVLFFRSFLIVLFIVYKVLFERIRNSVTLSLNKVI